jgi:virginiamycin B lyase
VVLKPLLAKLAAAAVLASALPAAGQGRGPAAPLPEGPGRELVQSQCSTCHGLSVVTNSPGYTAAVWLSLLGTMIVMPEEESAIVADYLARSFARKPEPNAPAVPRHVEVTLREWIVPSPDSKPHDSLATLDGALWWSGQDASVLGRLDPRRGEMKEFKTRTPGSGPRGLAADRDGNIWFAAGAKGYIGKLDPNTGQVTEYPTKNRRDPQSLLFDQKGLLWFTLPEANMVGRLDPKTGDVKMVASPTPKSNPDGLAISSKGIPFFVESGANKVASVDPKTMAIREYVLPAQEARPRRITITSDDRIWYSDYTRGYLGRLDPETGEVAEWRSPGGPQSQPYGMTALNDVIWYSESNVNPNTLVRFDPRTQKFLTWPIPSGGGVVRSMTIAGGAGLVLACSGVNGIALVEVRGDGALR